MSKKTLVEKSKFESSVKKVLKASPKLRQE